MHNALAQAKRIVIKIGSSLLAEAATGKLRAAWLKSLAQDIAACKQAGKDVIIVSSGAVALGRDRLQLGDKALKLDEKQAVAACGQQVLVQAWQEAMQQQGIQTAQILLTIDDSEVRRRFVNARATLERLLELGVIPVINENDTVATQELRFGDNDRLAARVAQMVSANILVLFSDIDGLYTKNPVRHDDAEHVDEVHEITAEINAMAGASSTQGSGGMITKLEAAEIALSAGCHMVIASGEHQHALKALQEGGKATWFMAKENPHSARKHWIAGSVNQNGAVMVDAGAANALKEGNSLLSAGVKAVEGGFEHGDVVQIKNEQGEVLGVGLIAYPSEEAQKILGRQSDDIEGILGYKRQSVLIHRDDMVLVSGECIGNKKRGQ